MLGLPQLRAVGQLLHVTFHKIPIGIALLCDGQAYDRTWHADGAPLSAIDAADLHVRALPDADCARDPTLADALAEALGEHHKRSATRVIGMNSAGAGALVKEKAPHCCEAFSSPKRGNPIQVLVNAAEPNLLVLHTMRFAGSG
jgi:hypothetical protein